MTTTYEKEIFDFFTVEESFKSLCKMVSHLPTIKNQLLHDFWEDVKNYTNSEFSKQGNQWQAKRLESVSSNISKLMIYKPEWGLIENGCPILAIGIERLSDNPFYGPFVHNRASNFDFKGALQYFRELNASLKLGYKVDNTTWYPFYLFSELQFKSEDDFFKILPTQKYENVELISKKLIDVTYGFENELGNVADKFLNLK